MKPMPLIAIVGVLQVIALVAFLFLARSGIKIIVENGGLRAGVESLWCGNAGCDELESDK